MQRFTRSIPVFFSMFLLFPSLSVAQGGRFGAQQIITTGADNARSVFAADRDTDVLSASSIDDKIAWYENLAITPTNLTRGPYLQIGTPTSVVVRWRTNNATNSRVRYSTNPNDLFSLVDASTITTEHNLTLSGLLSGTKYYYSVGSTSDTVGIGPDYFFITAPDAGTAKKSRIWVIGDAGTADANQRAVRDAYYAYTDTIHTELWVMLGDNAYENGSQSEYQAAVFDMYPTMLRKSVLWPAFGNHDAGFASSTTQTGPFYGIFTLPANGEAGGVATGT